MQAESEQSQRLYAKVAPRYDRVFERAILAEGRLTSLVKGYAEGRRVLDLACGNGRWLERLTPARYVGLDLSEQMLAQARERQPDCFFLRGDMAVLPFADESFEVAVSLFGGMGHLPPDGQQLMAREAARVLTPGGVAVFTNGNMWSPFNLPTTAKGNRFKLEGVRLKVHSTTPRRFAELLQDFSILRIESYDYSYLPIAPLKLFCALIGRDYRDAYGRLMDTLDHCTYIPTLRWFGKQLVAICRKR